MLLFAMLISLISCNKKGGGQSSGGDDDAPASNTPAQTTIVVPPYKDYGRSTVNFSDIVYSRPNIIEISEKFNTVTEIVELNEITLDEQIDSIKSLEDGFNKMRTMYSIAEIYSYKDSSVKFWLDEFEHLSTNYPTFSQSVENLLVACAKSPNRADFEEKYFEYSLEEYVDGGIYTDEVVALMSEEARIEAEYSSFSYDNVKISYAFKWEGTVTEILEMAKAEHGEGTPEYEREAMAIDAKYQQQLTILRRPIFVELIKVRRLIADEMGLKSYAELAYDGMGYDYTEKDMMTLISNIRKYVNPISLELEDYLQQNYQQTVDRVTLINNLYDVYKSIDPDLGDAYSYMLQHGLYDVSPSDKNRYDGAFTTYLESNQSPYLFVSTSGYAGDYLTVAHEFGHFFDGYVNYGDNASLDISEISSQSLELLTLLNLKSKLNNDGYKYLEALAMHTAMNSVLLTQSFYAAFEHIAYAMEYDDISEKSLNEAVAKAYYYVFGEDLGPNANLYMVMIPHTALYPFYVESYVTSGIVSLEIFFMESHLTGSAGAGIATYKELVTREYKDQTFSEIIDSAGLTSPFESGHVKEIANNIYYQRMGKYYYKDSDDLIGAA